MTLLLLAVNGAAAAQDFEAALEQARQLGQQHRYEEVIGLLTHFDDLEDPEAQYVVAAEIGRARFHLGDYGAANIALRNAVALRPQRVETALYLQATSYLIGDRDQAYAIFREIVASGATDLYLAVTLPGEKAFLADPAVWSILDELATPVVVDLDRGALLGIGLGRSQAEVETRFGADHAATGDTLTARAGPYLTWAFGFDRGRDSDPGHDAQRAPSPLYALSASTGSRHRRALEPGDRDRSSRRTGIDDRQRRRPCRDGLAQGRCPTHSRVRPSADPRRRPVFPPTGRCCGWSGSNASRPEEEDRPLIRTGFQPVLLLA